MFDQLSHTVANASAWAYAVVLVFALLDALVPVVPSEAAVITAGVVASTGNLLLPFVLVAAAVGAFLGDNCAYALGHQLRGRTRHRSIAAPALRRVQRTLASRGGELIVVARFLPGGRTAVTVTAGLTGYPWRVFARWDVLAAMCWSAYAGLLGFLGGRAFEDSPWKGLVVALGVAGAITVVTEVVGRSRGSSRQGEVTPPRDH